MFKKLLASIMVVAMVATIPMSVLAEEVDGGSEVDTSVSDVSLDSIDVDNSTGGLEVGTISDTESGDATVAAVTSVANAGLEISTAFPDEGLAVLVASWFDYDENGDSDGYLSDYELENATFLYTDGYVGSNGIEYQIKSFDGIEKLTSLNSLVIADMDMTSISLPYADMTSLISLTLSGVTLGNLDLSAATSLEGLSLYMSSLDSLDISKNTALTYLDISGSNLTSIDVSKNVNLEELYCKNTNLTSLDLSNNSKLGWVSAYNTDISVFDFSSCDLYYASVASSSLTNVILNENNSNGLSIVDKALLKMDGEDTYLASSWYQKDEEFTLPSNVTGIAYASIVGSNTPSVIEIPSSVEWIGANAFIDCSNLATVVIPEKLTIGSYLFDNCNNLESLYFRGATPFWTDVEDLESYQDPALEGMTLTIYYPEGDSDWAEFIKGEYGGDVTWVAWDPTSDVEGSGSGSGSDSGSVETPTESEVKVEATVQDSLASVEVSTEEISQAIVAGVDNEAGVNVTITVATGSEVAKIETAVSIESVIQLAEENVNQFTVTSDLVTMSFDADALKTISNQVEGDVAFVAEKLETTSLSEEAQALVGDRPVFEFSVIDSEGNMVTNFNGTVTVSIPYELQEGEDADNIVVYYIDADGNIEKMDNVYYDEVNKCAVFTTTHFSTYAIGYVESEASTSVSDVPETGDATNSTLPLVVCIAAVLGMCAVLEKRRAK